MNDYLPNELISEILSSIIYESVHRSPRVAAAQPRISSIDIRNHPLWVLSKVCSRWRQCLLTLPHLWSYIHVHVDSKQSERTRSILRLFISRSQDQLLHVSVHNDLNPSYARPYDIKIQILLQHCQRWRTLSLSGEFPNVLLLTGDKEDAIPELTSLESFRVSCDYARDPADEDYPMLTTPLSKAPQLRQVRATIGFRAIAAQTELPWHQLTDVTLWIYPGELDRFRALLMHMDVLVSAELKFRCEFRKALGQSPLENRNLRSLTVVCRDGAGLADGALRMPMLESLTMKRG